MCSMLRRLAGAAPSAPLRIRGPLSSIRPMMPFELELLSGSDSIAPTSRLPGLVKRMPPLSRRSPRPHVANPLAEAVQVPFSATASTSTIGAVWTVTGPSAPPYTEPGARAEAVTASAPRAAEVTAPVARALALTAPLARQSRQGVLLGQVDPALAAGEVDVVGTGHHRKVERRGASDQRRQQRVEGVVAVDADLARARGPAQPGGLCLDRRQQLGASVHLGAAAVGVLAGLVGAALDAPKEQRRARVDLDHAVGAGAIKARPRALEGPLAQLRRAPRGEGEAVGGDAEPARASRRSRPGPSRGRRGRCAGSGKPLCRRPTTGRSSRSRRSPRPSPRANRTGRRSRPNRPRRGERPGRRRRGDGRAVLPIS